MEFEGKKTYEKTRKREVCRKGRLEIRDKHEGVMRLREENWKRLKK